MYMLPIVIALVGCEPKATPPPAPSDNAPAEQPAPEPGAPDPTPADAEAFTLAGSITEIRMQNINKAQGKFTYNVELQVKVASVTPTREAVEQVTVRVDKLYWSDLPKEKASQYAPEGPHQLLKPLKYGEYEVGQDVELNVRFSGPELAHKL